MSICTPRTLFPVGPIEPPPVEDPFFPQPEDAGLGSVRIRVVSKGRLAAPARCHRCGGEARVRILVDYAKGAPLAKRFCLECADRAYDERTGSGAWFWNEPLFFARCVVAFAALAVAYRALA